jgi:hypothetical protein
MSVELNSIRDPEQVLRALVAADVQGIYARDLGLAAELDVSPPPVDPDENLVHRAPFSPSADSRGLAYRAARKIYRKLKHWKSLLPILEKVRDEIRRRS